MAGIAQGAKVVPLEEEFRVCLAWLDVIDHLRRFHAAFCLTLRTEGMELAVIDTQPAPLLLLVAAV